MKSPMLNGTGGLDNKSILVFFGFKFFEEINSIMHNMIGVATIAMKVFYYAIVFRWRCSIGLYCDVTK